MSDVTLNKIKRVALALLGIGAAIYLAYYFIDILLMLAISVLLTFIFHPFVCELEKRGFSRGWAIFTLLLAGGLLIFLGIYFLIPVLSEQMTTLTDSVRHANLKQTLMNFDRSVSRYIPFIRPGTVYSRIESFASTIIMDLLNSMSFFLSSLLSLAAVLVIVPFMTFFILRDNKIIVKGIINIVPNRYFEMSYAVIRQISVQLGRFVRGWLFDAFMVGLLSGIGLSLLGINNAIPIGIVAGVGHLIPYFGPIIGGIPAIIISVAQFGDFSMLPKIVIMFLGVYAIDNGLIQPNVFSKSVDMHPIVIIVLIIAGSQIMGVLGMLLAVPTATVLRTAAKEIYNAYKNYTIIRT
ncbi:MAG: AI-2E family transporter [Ignavibacteria bacterium]|jgi:predicted PurR-regulated permease PerM|nr:AI-2E family transporter [Ignavibacteria bacterium]MCU7502411.1 AI-2E family transporter [Ignavibacteria bacterium]MCU7515024.1 AI-2E family transporter [Ignavibacteria bacterium]